MLCLLSIKKRIIPIPANVMLLRPPAALSMEELCEKLLLHKNGTNPVFVKCFVAQYLANLSDY